MTTKLFKKLKRFRKQQKLSIAELCRQIGAHYTTYHRWKNSGQITGPYKKIVEEFLERNTPSRVTVKTDPATQASLSPTSEIAVIGMACYYPGAANISELWENILARRVQFRRMLDQRLPLSEYYDEDPKTPEKTYLTKAAFLENFQFDWGKLRIPKKTVESTDIAHWLALDIALKTFEDAGYKLNEIPLQNTGVIVGNTLTGEQTRSQTLRLRWPYVQKALNATLWHLGKSSEESSHIASEMEKIYKSAFYPVTEDSLAGGLANTIAGRICNYLNLKGGGYIVDGACSSSLLAVATAADALKMGNMDVVLAGGVDISLDPFELVGFAKAGALAKDQMRVYDKQANGFLPGEGCGFVLLKRLDDALRDKNYIYAVIKGWGISSDGKGGIMEPSSSGQAFAIGRAYKGLEYKISDVDFVEGHGTGTTKGDRVELEGISTAIDQSITKGNKNRSCGVTSFKSIVGHTKAAAGVGGLIKAILAVNQRILPPTASCTDPNEVFQDKAKHLYPIIQGGFLDQNKTVRAGISSAGFGGINCHITIESKNKPKEILKPKIEERALFVSQQQTEVFVFTSRTIIHLKKIIQKFKEDLRNISIAEMADLAALLNQKVKNRLPIKAAIVTDSPEHLYDALTLLEQEVSSSQVEEGQIHRIKAKDTATRIILSNAVKKSRVGFLYPGQGSQRLNMTRTLVERYSWARDYFKLSKLPLFENVYPATDQFFTQEEQLGFEKKLSDTKITQPAVILSSLIWTEFLSKLGVEPQCVAGHSLGELAAFYKGGAFSKETLVKFAQLRGELMAAGGRLSGSMVSLFCSKNKAEELVSKVSGNIVIANINSPSQIIVSGGKKEIEKVKELAKKENITAFQLNVSNAFHSSFMKEASNKIKKTTIFPDKYKSNEIKVYSCMSGEAISDRVNLKEYFSKQAISPVNFVGVVESFQRKECDLMIEVGPGRVLTDLVKAINKEILCLPVESVPGNERDLNIVLAELFIRNTPVKWEELYKNRLIRTFVPASRKKFIENQCERPLKIDKQVLQNKFLPVLLKIEEDADQLEEIIPGGLPEVKGKDHIADLLINLTHEITGFDVGSISLNLRLLDDLNLDSIKAAELIGKAARTLGIPGQVDPSQLSNNTLGQIRDQLNELVTMAKTGPIKESINDILKRYQDKTWVRDFVLDLKSEEIKTKNVNQLKELKEIVFLLGKNEEVLVKELENEFKIIKAKSQRIYFGDTPGKEKKSSRIDCLIAVLPKSTSNNELDKASLKKIMGQLHQITELATSSRLDKDSFVVFVQFGGGATAIASTLYLERPDLKVRVIDFDERIDANKIAQKIIDELQTYESFSSTGYDSKLTRRVAYYENSYPATYKKRNISWSNKDVVLVTGGAKGITAQCALEFARSTKARMVLVGRSPLPEGKRDDTNEIIQTIKQFENENLKCSYYKCDVSSEKDVVSAIGEIEKKVGKITGFIHGAGLNSLKRLKQTNVQEVFQEALPKVMGAVNICNALKNHPPKLIVGITSIIGLTGMEGSGWYGLSNEILNLYLHKVFHPPMVGRVREGGTDVVSIAYSVWDEVGMGAKLGSVNRLAEKGIGAIPVKEGIKHFRQLIEDDPGVQQVIVAARVAGISTWKSVELKPNHFRFLEKLEYVLPGVELIAQAHLNIEDDPYLLDHNWKGSLLFPFVFGFEAMAQAVAYVLGIEKFDHIKARDIDLQRPIPVPPESGTTIEIHAQVLEQDKSNGNRQVKVEIYSQETAYKEPHFSAIFEVGSGVIARSEATKQSLLKKASNVIDLNMQTDIYGPILFQGKSFQCIERIHELYYDKETNKGECIFTSVYNNSKKYSLKSNKKFNHRFLIGDLFFIDSILQSMQLIIPQDISLPRDIKELELILFKEEFKAELIAQSEIKKIDMDYYRGDAQAIKDNFLLRVKNCRLKVLDTNIDNPSANDLADPLKRDRVILENAIIKYSRELGIKLPHFSITHIPEINRMSKEERHKAELPFIEESVLSFLKENDKSIINLVISWRKDGGPYISSNLSGNPSISLSHEGSLIICSLGNEKQAIDLQTILSRTNEEWRSLLGDRKFSNIEQFAGEQLNYFATSIWASGEVCIKAGLTDKHQDFKIERFIENKYYLLKNDKYFFISLVVQFSRGPAKLLTFLLKDYKLVPEPSVNEQLGFGEKYFHFHAEYSGPQQQLVTIKKFPVTFKNSKLKSRRVYFSSYFDWVGEIREFSLLSILKELADVVETKEWGIATNNVMLDIKGEVRSSDIVEARLWLAKRLNENVFDLDFEFRRQIEGDKFELLATGTQRVSWVKILGHGKARVNKLPIFLEDIMQKMEPKSKIDKTPESLKELYSDCHINLKELINDYGENGPFLRELRIQTTLEESNLVGNIYFANYPIWIGRVTDYCFYNLWPELYTQNEINNEFVCVQCKIDHLNEAMPFDLIIIRMYLKELYSNGLVLKYEILANNGKKLAIAKQSLVWINRTEVFEPIVDSLPNHFVNKILESKT